MPAQFDQFIAALQKRLAEILIAAIFAAFVVVGNLWLSNRDHAHLLHEYGAKLDRLAANIASCGKTEQCERVDARVRELERDVARLQARP